MEQETFWTLLHNLPHWEFEIFLMILFDGIIGALVWGVLLRPKISKFFKHHKTDDEKIAALEEAVKQIQENIGLEENDK